MTDDKPAWPRGLFPLRGDERLTMRCASEGCFQGPTMRLEVGGVGSVYCVPCAQKIATMMQERE